MKKIWGSLVFWGVIVVALTLVFAPNPILFTIGAVTVGVSMLMETKSQFVKRFEDVQAGKIEFPKVVEAALAILIAGALLAGSLMITASLFGGAK